MKFFINTINDNGSGISYKTKEELIKEISLMVDDCIANGGTFMEFTIDSDASCFLVEEDTEIIPTREEKKDWKEYLYDSLMFLATERPEFRPRKSDSLEDLKESFFYWASKYNDGYFSERDDADNDRYSAWLVQEYEKYC